MYFHLNIFTFRYTHLIFHFYIVFFTTSPNPMNISPASVCSPPTTQPIRLTHCYVRLVEILWLVEKLEHLLVQIACKRWNTSTTVNKLYYSKQTQNVNDVESILNNLKKSPMFWQFPHYWTYNKLWETEIQIELYSLTNKTICGFSLHVFNALRDILKHVEFSQQYKSITGDFRKWLWPSKKHFCT